MGGVGKLAMEDIAGFLSSTSYVSFLRSYEFRHTKDGVIIRPIIKSLFEQFEIPFLS